VTGQRAEWLKFITHPTHGGRYLFVRGESQYSELHDEGASLPTVLKGLEKTTLDAKLLVSLHFLNAPAVQTFIRVHARALARVALHTSVRSRTVSAGGIRGKVNWPRTILENQTSATAEPRYHLDVPRRTSDLPENRLLKLFLSDVSRLVATCRLYVPSGQVGESLQATSDHTKVALREPHIRDLVIGRQSTTLMRQRARRNRDTRYHILAALQYELEQIGRYGRREAVLSLLRRGWFEPIQDDDIFELYLLVTILDVIEKELGAGAPVQYGLVRAHRSAVAEFAMSGKRIKIYFDQGPSAYSQASSEYLRVARAYGLSVAERRPDLAVIVEGAKRNALLFVEAKKTSDDRYERDSVYKALGYLRDFATSWESAPDNVPRVVVAYPAMSVPGTGFKEPNEQLVLVSAASRTRIADVLQAVVNSTS